MPMHAMSSAKDKLLSIPRDVSEIVVAASVARFA